MYQSSRPPQSISAVCVTPKRLLAQRLLRSVAARQSVKLAPSSALSTELSTELSLVLRPVEVRCVIASGSDGPLRQHNGLPRMFASGWEGPRNSLLRAFHNLKRAARATKFQRLAGRFAPSSQRALASQSVASESVASVVFQSSSSVASKSRLH
jgi:hypothetical protein